MKKAFLLLVVAMTTVTALAQRTVSGKVIEKDSREAIIQGTVALLKADSSLVANGLTNMDGQFQLTAPQDGNYIVRITYIGFKAYTKAVTVSGKPVDMGTITISPDSKLLKDVEVVKNIAKVTTKDDTIVYNAGAYRTPEGSVVEELVKKLPGAEVSDDGTITINGKQVKKVLIDGKEFMTGDTKTAIKNLPTSIVDRIKSYDEKSDLSRITGIDDGEEQTVLDFGLKRGMNRGVFANVDLAAGTEKRYSGRGMGAVMKDDLRAMAFASGNNVNDMGFPGGGGRGFGGGRQGLTASKMAAVNLNYEKKGVVRADGSVRWNHSDGDSWSRRSSENFMGTNGSFSNSINQNYSRSNSWNVQGRVEWTPDTLWNISFRPTWSYGTNDGTGSSTSATFNEDPYKYSDDPLSMLGSVDSAIIVNSRRNGSLSYSDSRRIGGNLQLNRKLGGGGRNITLRLNANYSDGDSRSMSDNTVNLYQGLSYLASIGDSVSNYQTNRYNLTPQESWDYSVRATYSEPIARAVFLQFSYEFQYKYTKSDRSTYDFSMPPYTRDDFDLSGLSYAYRGWNSYLDRLTQHHALQDYYDEALSRFSQYKNYIHTGEIMLRVVRKAYNFNVGVQVIPQSSEFTYRYQTADTVANRSVINWSPTANFRWKLSDRGQMRFEYRGRTSQPSMTQLLPITDNSDPLNISEGNAQLKPSFTQSFNWRYNDFFERHQRFVFANLNFSTTSNQVANRVEYNELTGGSTSRPENISGQWNAGGRFVMNTAIDTTGFFNVNTNTSLNYDHSVGYLYQNKTTSKNYTNTINVGERLGASYRNEWLEVELNGNVNYIHARNHLQSASDLDTWSFGYGFSTNVQFPWGMQLHTDLGMSSRRGYNDASLNTNELLWNAQLSQGFLTGKPLTVTLQFYDILRQQSNLSRTINAMSRTDNEYNAINSYVMLHAIYRLNLFGTKEARAGMGGMGPGGPEGGRGGAGRGMTRGFGGGRPGGGFGGGR